MGEGLYVAVLTQSATWGVKRGSINAKQVKTGGALPWSVISVVGLYCGVLSSWGLEISPTKCLGMRREEKVERGKDK